MAPASPETRSLARVSAGEPLPLLFFADGYRFPDVYHTTRLLTPDPIIALEEVEELVVVASSLEEGRARELLQRFFQQLRRRTPDTERWQSG